MKKYFLIIVLAIMPVPLCASTVFLNMFDGPVSIENTDKGKPDSSVPGIPIGHQTVVKTAEGGFAEISMLSDQGNALITLSEKCTVTFLFDPKDQQRLSKIEVIEGSIRGVFSELTSKVLITNQLGVTQVEGTRLVVGQSDVVLLEGKITVDRKDGKTSRLFPGERIAKTAKSISKQTMLINDLLKVDRQYDHQVPDGQIPYAFTEQYWIATLARDMGYHLPKGWQQYSPADYLELFANETVDNKVGSFRAVDNPNSLKIRTDTIGNQTLVAGDTLTATFGLAVPTKGTYYVNTARTGGPQYWTVVGKQTVVSVESDSGIQSDVGPFILDKGLYELAISVPKGGTLSDFRLKGDLVGVPTPEKGWQKDKVLTYGVLSEVLALIYHIPYENMSERSQAIETLEAKGFLIKDLATPVLGSDDIMSDISSSVRRVYGQSPLVLTTGNPLLDNAVEVEENVGDSRSALSPIMPIVR